jgi:hypothetical protein
MPDRVDPSVDMATNPCVAPAAPDKLGVIANMLAVLGAGYHGNWRLCVESKPPSHTTSSPL